MTPCRTDIETVSQIEKAWPFDRCCSHQSVASPSLCLCPVSRWTFCAIFILHCVQVYNYRGITLLSVPGKVFAHIILARIKPTLLSHRRPQQSRFMPGCSTCDRIATLCNIAQRRQDFGHPTFAAFVDLRAAFDCLSRPALWLLLTRLGIPDKIVRLFRVLYDNC